MVRLPSRRAGGNCGGAYVLFLARYIRNTNTSLKNSVRTARTYFHFIRKK